MDRALSGWAAFADVIQAPFGCQAWPSGPARAVQGREG